MQDVIFYVSASQPLGTVQNNDGSEPVNPPVLVRGVPVRLCARLFSSADGGTAYPAEKLADIARWTFVMDADFNPDTTYKVIADNDSIELVTSQSNPPEVRIPITDMDSPELAAMLGTSESICLTGELVGYNAEGYAVFVLQVKGFSIRNRIMTLDTATSSISSADIAALINAGVEVQYSTNAEEWHYIRTSSDCFMRLRVEGPTAWSGAIKIQKETTMPNKVDVWGHSELERDYMVMPALPYETDATTADTGVVYTRYLNREITCVHKTTTTDTGNGRQTIKNEVCYGAWNNRQNLVYESPENFPKVV